MKATNHYTTIFAHEVYGGKLPEIPSGWEDVGLGKATTTEEWYLPFNGGPPIQGPCCEYRILVRPTKPKTYHVRAINRPYTGHEVHLTGMSITPTSGFQLQVEEIRPIPYHQIATALDAERYNATGVGLILAVLRKLDIEVEG